MEYKPRHAVPSASTLPKQPVPPRSLDAALAVRRIIDADWLTESSKHGLRQAWQVTDQHLAALAAGQERT